tara:strand:- start:7912 stop:8181 length:270 start_codon:yes stop_codon:yes gene_type:complete
MKTMIQSIKILHLLLIVSLILLISLLPILINAEILTNLLYLPLAYLALAITSFNIENKLNKYITQINAQSAKGEAKKCLINRGICCLHA